MLGRFQGAAALLAEQSSLLEGSSALYPPFSLLVYPVPACAGRRVPPQRQLPWPQPSPLKPAFSPAFPPAAQALRVQADVFRRNAERLAAEGDDDDVALVGAILDVSECCARVHEVGGSCSFCSDWLSGWGAVVQSGINTSRQHLEPSCVTALSACAHA